MAQDNAVAVNSQTKGSVQSIRRITPFLIEKESIIAVLILVIFIHLVGFFSPSCTHFLDIDLKTARGIAGNLFAAYISILGLGLAISAIVLAIVQIANRRISITHLIFSRSYLMPLVYYGLINIVLLALAQLLYRNEDLVFYEEPFIQYVVVSIYSFAIFIILTFLVFYRTFRYLNFMHVIDDFIKDVHSRLTLTNEADFLSMRGREVRDEITDAIENEDNVMLDKFLLAFVEAHSVNATSTFLFDLELKLANWQAKAFNDKKYNIFSTVVVAWREMRSKSISNASSDKFSYVQTSAKAIVNIPEKREEAAFYFALHLKELVIYSSLPSSTSRKYSASYIEVANYLRDFFLIIEALIVLKDEKAIKKVYNQIGQMISFLESEIQEKQNQFRPVEQQRESDAEEISQQKLLLQKIYYLLLSVFSLYVYRISFHSMEGQADKSIYDLLTKYFYQRGNFIDLNSIFNLKPTEPVDWRSVTWSLVEREDGKGYAVESQESILAYGMLNLYLTYSHLKIADLQFYLERQLAWVEANKEQAIKVMPHLSEAGQLDEALQRLKGNVGNLQMQKESAQIALITASVVSEPKIESFRQRMALQWESTRNIYKLFKYFKATEVADADIKLQQVGTNRLRIPKGRMLFIDGEGYETIHGIEWGKMVNRGVENLLNKRIAESGLTNIKCTSVSDALAQATEKLPENSAIVAFLPAPAFYRGQVDLLNSGKYQSFDNNNPFPFDGEGMYAERIIVVRLDKGITENSVLVMSLPEAVHYQQRLDGRFIDDQLQVSINLSDYNQHDAENPNGPENAEDAIVLVQEIMDFKIIKKDRIIMFQID